MTEDNAKKIYNNFVNRAQVGRFYEIEEFIEKTEKDELIEFCKYNNIVSAIIEHTKKQIKDLIVMYVYTDLRKSYRKI